MSKEKREREKIKRGVQRQGRIGETEMEQGKGRNRERKESRKGRKGRKEIREKGR